MEIINQGEDEGAEVRYAKIDGVEYKLHSVEGEDSSDLSCDNCGATMGLLTCFELSPRMICVNCYNNARKG